MPATTLDGAARVRRKRNVERSSTPRKRNNCYSQDVWLIRPTHRPRNVRRRVRHDTHDNDGDEYVRRAKRTPTRDVTRDWRKRTKTNEKQTNKQRTDGRTDNNRLTATRTVSLRPPDSCSRTRSVFYRCVFIAGVYLSIMRRRRYCNFVRPNHFRRGACERARRRQIFGNFRDTNGFGSSTVTGCCGRSAAAPGAKNFPSFAPCRPPARAPPPLRGRPTSSLADNSSLRGYGGRTHCQIRSGYVTRPRFAAAPFVPPHRAVFKEIGRGDFPSLSITHVT